jgi:hypothetical protein
MAGIGFSSATFIATEPTTIVNPATGQAVAATATHTFLPRISSALIATRVQYAPVSRIFLFASGEAMLPFSARFTATQTWSAAAGIIPAPKESSGNIGSIKTVIPSVWNNTTFIIGGRFCACTGRCGTV